jgi:FKBP-type peptidyl-prolyl cis-trans isomerase
MFRFLGTAMTLTSLVWLSTTTRTARAFTLRSHQHALAVSAHRNTATRALSAGPPGPVPEDRMPFYALGVNLAVQVGGQANIQTLLEQDELDVVLQAFGETLRGTSTVEPRDILAQYGPQLNEILGGRSSKLLDRVKAEGASYIKNFMDCNPEAKQTESGLVYCPTTEGQGASPSLQSTVEVHYHGSLTDGTVFDSSVERGQTISFPLGGVIKGWQEGLLLMKEGGKATLVCPADIAYGDAGSGDVIAPGATLKFDVELFKVS